MFNKKTVLFLVFTSSIFFFSCKTTSSLQVHNLNEDQLYYVAQDIQFDELEEEGPYKYLFIRMYDPSYKNPFYIANLLKGGIKATEVTSLNFSHSSINFSLDDYYFALTAVQANVINRESCTNPSLNGYMEKSNPKTSIQATYALKVTEEEYNNFIKFLISYTFYKPIKYEVLINFKMAFFSVDRKFFTTKDKQTFGNVDYGNINYLKKEHGNNKNFVCSSFVAYALINSVPRIAKWFEEKKIDYHYVNVTDLPMIPGVKEIFTSNWENYLVASQEFINQYPEFSEYLNIE